MAKNGTREKRWTPEQQLDMSAVLVEALTAYRDGTGKKADTPKKRGWCTVLLAKNEMQIVRAKLAQAEAVVKQG